MSSAILKSTNLQQTISTFYWIYTFLQPNSCFEVKRLKQLVRFQIFLHIKWEEITVQFVRNGVINQIKVSWVWIRSKCVSLLAAFLTNSKEGVRFSQISPHIHGLWVFVLYVTFSGFNIFNIQEASAVVKMLNLGRSKLHFTQNRASDRSSCIRHFKVWERRGGSRFEVSKSGPGLLWYLCVGASHGA